ncbi:lycopene cyclase family protein [Demequina sp.]|uniref:lycopene cyclase family protein n=1 Tax=Demequina sp. TaxID=2050685 RepID=UPI0025C727AD|nr:lycopene cyclase family protein [Demequina sp.]
MTPAPPLPGERFDAVIVGAGAAGLSLACHLADAGWGDKVLIVDDASHPLEARSWAWWSKGTGLLDSAASVEVRHLRVAGGGWRRTQALEPYSYRRITGPELSAETDRIIGARPGYRRVVGSARALAREGAGCRVLIDVPEPGGARTVEVSARWVFDSVGLGVPSASPASAAYLDFHGLHIECPTDVFDPGTATLMDFRTDQTAGAAFVYVLPTSARSALVERTVFAFSDTYDRGLHGARHEDHVRDYIGAHVRAGAYKVTGREVGTIPLQRGPAPTPKGPVIPIGATAGMVRASTGYGFARIQRHSAAIASCLARGRHPASAAPARRWSRALDDALLRVIREDRTAAVELFATLFTRNPAPRILAFLEEEASPLSQIALCVTLPVGPFLRAQVRAATGTRAANPRVPYAESDTVSHPSR